MLVEVQQWIMGILIRKCMNYTVLLAQVTMIHDDFECYTFYRATVYINHLAMGMFIAILSDGKKFKIHSFQLGIIPGILSKVKLYLGGCIESCSIIWVALLCYLCSWLEFLPHLVKSEPLNYRLLELGQTFDVIQSRCPTSA